MDEHHGCRQRRSKTLRWKKKSLSDYARNLGCIDVVFARSGKCKVSRVAALTQKMVLLQTLLCLLLLSLSSWCRFSVRSRRPRTPPPASSSSSSCGCCCCCCCCCCSCCCWWWGRQWWWFSVTCCFRYF